MTARKFLNKIHQINSTLCQEKNFVGEPNCPPEFYLLRLNPQNNPTKAKKLLSLMNYCIGCGYIYCEMTRFGTLVNISPYGFSHMLAWKENLLTITISALTGSFATCLGVLLSFVLTKY